MRGFCHKITKNIKEKINSNTFISQHKKSKRDFTRQRKLPFAKIISTILKLSKKSLHIECELLENDSEVMPPSKQAFSSARYKFSHTGFIELFNDSLETIYKDDKETGLWKGYRFLATDGSSVRLPESKSTKEYFGKFKCNGNQSPKRAPVLGRVSLTVDICTSIIVDAAIENWGVGEISIASQQLPLLVEKLRIMGQDKLCFIYDRGYVSSELIQQHIELGVDFILRLQKRTFKNIWQRVNSGEVDFISTINENAVRVAVVQLKTGEKEVLITALASEDFSLVDLCKLYNMRWNIEEIFKKLKIISELENFSGKHLEAILQDFWAHMLMCNILSLMILDKEAPIMPNKLPDYKINFSVLLGATRHKLREYLINECEFQEVFNIFERVSKRAKVKVVPNRSFDRTGIGKPRRAHFFRRVC